MVIVNPFQELKAPKSEKIFLAVGTSEVEEWATCPTPYVLPMQSREDFREHGFEDEYEKANRLNVGEVMNSADYAGVMLIRVQ